MGPLGVKKARLSLSFPLLSQRKERPGGSLGISPVHGGGVPAQFQAGALLSFALSSPNQARVWLAPSLPQAGNCFSLEDGSSAPPFHPAQSFASFSNPPFSFSGPEERRGEEDGRMLGSAQMSLSQTLPEAACSSRGCLPRGLEFVSLRSSCQGLWLTGRGDSLAAPSGIFPHQSQMHPQAWELLGCLRNQLSTLFLFVGEIQNPLILIKKRTPGPISRCFWG